jgi:ribosomal protein S15P/S13E
MKKSIFSYSASATSDEVNLGKIGSLEARNHLLTEQVQNLEKNISVLNQTIVHLTTHQQQKDEDSKKYSMSILKKDKQMREFLKRLERVGKLVYILQQYQVVSLITDGDLKQLYETSQRY